MRATRSVVQAKSSTSLRGPTLPATRGFGKQRPSGGKPLPGPLQAKMEGAFGHSLSDVRVHLGNLPEKIGANAFARGSDLFFKRTNYDPGSRKGQALIGHELAHVVQQRQRRVAPTHVAGPLLANQESHLESEAEKAGESVSVQQPKPLPGALIRSSTAGGAHGSAPPIQLNGKKRLLSFLGFGGAGRRVAVSHTRRFPPGTLGSVVHRAVKPTHRVFGDFASGNIGQHYIDRSEDLAAKPTPENIESFAKTETNWWKQQPGLAGAVGGSFPWWARSNILKFTNAPILEDKERNPWWD